MGGECPDWSEDYEVRTAFELDIAAVERTVREVCAPDQGTEVSDSCYDLLLSLWPLGDALDSGTDADSLLMQDALVRATRVMLFYPLVSDGQIMAVGEGHYCEGITEGFLAAQGAALNTDLLRHLVERMDTIESDFEFNSESDSDDDMQTIAYVPEGSNNMYVTEIFSTGIGITEASTLIHEARHIDDGFSVDAQHVTCDHGQDQGAEGACDSEGIYGSYGTQVQYFDALLKGSGETVKSDGQYLMSDYEVELSVFYICYYLQNRINGVASELLAPFEGKDCYDLDNDSAAFDALLAEQFGVVRGVIQTARSKTSGGKAPGRGLIDRKTVRVPIFR